MTRKDYSFIDALRDVASGRAEYSTKEEFLQRITICSTCDHMTKLTKQCKKCGCFIHSKAKFKQSTCPINKWK